MDMPPTNEARGTRASKMPRNASAPTVSNSPSLGLRIRIGRLSYGDAPLLENFALDLAPGSFTCLLGPSGIGKSTLLKAIVGLVQFEETAALANESITCSDGVPIDGRAAYMDQRDLLLPWRTALDNVLLGPSLRNEPADRTRALALLESVGMREFADRRPGTLSGGQRQRVALARTLMENKPIVLMDEPFAALDALTRHRIQRLFSNHLAGRTTLLITHDPLEALRLANRIHVMTGLPARLSEPLDLPGLPPRGLDSKDITRLHSELLVRLGAA